uniref:Uncharacterized protein n=1 Tax=Eutreptiella gymnastica TaxID=73025 RepID=A0A7S4CEP6_9EUGL
MPLESARSMLQSMQSAVGMWREQILNGLFMQLTTGPDKSSRRFLHCQGICTDLLKVVQTLIPLQEKSGFGNCLEEIVASSHKVLTGVDVSSPEHLAKFERVKSRANFHIENFTRELHARAVSQHFRDKFHLDDPEFWEVESEPLERRGLVEREEEAMGCPATVKLLKRQSLCGRSGY